MTGPKLNEKSFVVGERSGTKATAKYVRASASKARVVLDLIRGLDVVSADRCCSSPIATSPVTSARCSPAPSPTPSTTTSQDADELFVVACFADEGPTLKRFRPRARGRATRINKRFVPHHRHRRPHERRPHRRHPGPPGACRWHGRPWSPADERRQPSCPRRAQPQAGRPGQRSGSDRRDRRRRSPRPPTSRTWSTRPPNSPPTSRPKSPRPRATETDEPRPKWPKRPSRRAKT